MSDTTLLATLTCPNPTCQHQQRVMMPTTYCQLSYTCKACSMTHAHKSGDCCVFCSYADKPCPSMQGEGTCSAHLDAPLIVQVQTPSRSTNEKRKRRDGSAFP